MQIFVNTNYDFVKWRFHAVAFSLLFMLVGGVLYATRGVNWGIDFAGGANVVLKFKDTVPLDVLRHQLADATIQQYGKADDHAVLIRLPQQKREGDYAGAVVATLNRALNPEAATRHDLNFQGRDALAELLKASDPDHKGTGLDANTYYVNMAQAIISHRSELGLFHSMSEVTSVPGVSSAVSSQLSDKAFLGQFNVLNQETVGPQVGKELQTKAIWAVILSALAMGVYITLRFDLKFGVGAIACIVHDLAIALAFLPMINGEFSLNIVAALLLIVGYSINDTVVTYDRVRENAKKTRGRVDSATQLNLAMNQTLSRTILTSGSVVLVLVALILFGGKVIHEFSMVLLVGVIAGTYSTVTIVPAVAIAWDRRIGKSASYYGASTARARAGEPAKPAPAVVPAKPAIKPAPRPADKRAKG
jgi:preprotein translocase subunit SecF